MKITARDIRMFVAGALALAGVRALFEIPYFLTGSRSSALFGEVMACAALPIGIGIFLGRWSAFFLAQIYLWLKFIGGCVVLAVYWCFFHVKIGQLALGSVRELLIAAVLLGLIFWTTSERFRYEPDA